MPSESKILLIFLSYFLIFGIPLYLVFKSRAIIRMIRMKKIALNHGLNFERSVDEPFFQLLYPLYPGKGKKNRIYGQLNGCSVEIYDYIIVPILSIMDRGIEHHTIFIENGKIIDDIGFFGGFFRVSVKKINNKLNSIKIK